MSASSTRARALALHVLTLAEATAVDADHGWRDPDGLAALSPGKRAALRANPFARDGDAPAMIVGTLDGLVIGKLDVLPGAIDLGGETIPCAWDSALIVQEEHRSTGLGVKLVLKLQGLSDTVATCGVSKLAHRMFAGLRWADFALERHVLVRRSRPVLRRRLGDAAATVAAPLVDGGLLLHRGALAALATARARGLHVERVDEIPAAWDERLRPRDGRVAFHRPAAWYGWVARHRFFDEPENAIVPVVVSRRDHPVGLVLVKARRYERASSAGYPDLLLGSVLDWHVLDPGAVDDLDLVLLATRELGRLGVDAVEVCLPPELASLPLARLGFARADALHLLVRASSRSPLAEARFREPASWRLRPADGDNVFS